MESVIAHGQGRPAPSEFHEFQTPKVVPTGLNSGCMSRIRENESLGSNCEDYVLYAISVAGGAIVLKLVEFNCF